MEPKVKAVKLVSRSNPHRVTVSDWPATHSSARGVKAGDKVLVQTPRSRKIGFYILLEIVRREDDGRYVGQVLGPEGYQGDRNVIYPGETIEFNFDGLKCDDLVYVGEHDIV